MKITDVQAIYLRLPEIQQRTDCSQDPLLVKVSTDPSRNALIMEYCVELSEISQHLAKRPIAIHDGVAHLPQEPGLGVEPNPQIIEKYLVRA